MLHARSILKSRIWFQTKLHSTQFNYHYKSVSWSFPSLNKDTLVIIFAVIGLVILCPVLLFPVDRDTHEICFGLQTNVFIMLIESKKQLQICPYHNLSSAD